MTRSLTHHRPAKANVAKGKMATDAKPPTYITNYLADMGRSDRGYAGYVLHEEPAVRLKVDIWMPMHWGDYFKDTMDLSCLEHGAYLQLIGNYWVRQGALPDDDVRLSNMTQLTLEEWAPIRRALERFFVIRDGFWHHKRIEEEILKAIANREAKRGAGKASAEKRRGNKACSETPTELVTEAQQKPNPSPVIPVPVPPPLTGLVLQAQEARGIEGEPVLEDMTEQQVIDYCDDLFGKAFMKKHGGSWRLRFRDNKTKLFAVLRELRSSQREGKPIRCPGAYADDLWKRFA